MQTTSSPSHISPQKHLCRKQTVPENCFLSICIMPLQDATNLYFQPNEWRLKVSTHLPHTLQQLWQKISSICKYGTKKGQWYGHVTLFSSSTGTDPCSMNNGNCEHECRSNNTYHYCTCRAGYRLHGNLRNCVDIDECATIVPCGNLTCKNLPGFYEYV